MAVTMTLVQLRDFISNAGEFAAAGDDATRDRLWDYLPNWYATAKAIIERYAPAAPDPLHNRALKQIIMYWLESPENTGLQRMMTMEFSDQQWGAKRSANALRHSGAMALLSPFKRRRALSTATDREPLQSRTPSTLPPATVTEPEKDADTLSPSDRP